MYREREREKRERERETERERERERDVCVFTHMYIYIYIYICMWCVFSLLMVVIATRCQGVFHGLADVPGSICAFGPRMQRIVRCEHSSVPDVDRTSAVCR